MTRHARTLVILAAGFEGLASWSEVSLFVNSDTLDAVLALQRVRS